MQSRSKRLMAVAAVVVAGATMAGMAALSCASCARTVAVRPSAHAWAQRLALEGVPNFAKVSDTLYRGAQPSAEGMRSLSKMGIKTIVSLRAIHSDRGLIGDLPLGYVHVSMKPWHGEYEDVVEFLRAATEPRLAPVLVHCEFGSDRTGTMCAAYRIVVCGWSKEEAIDEMVNGGFGFHKQWQNLIVFVRELDVDRIKRQLGEQTK